MAKIVAKHVLPCRNQWGVVQQGVGCWQTSRALFGFSLCCVGEFSLRKSVQKRDETANFVIRTWQNDAMGNNTKSDKIAIAH